MTLKIGKSKFGGRQQRKDFKLKDGDQAYRICPPVGSLADSGRWSMFHSVHWGYKTSDGKQKPFISPEVKNRKNGMTEVPDAAKDRIVQLSAEYEKAKKTGNKVAFEALNELVGPTGMYNLDNNHYMNVIDAQGNVGVLKLRHKAKLALELEMGKLNARGVDPTSVDDGRFFVFSRTGKGRDTTFSVRVMKEKINVPGVGEVEKEIVHSLDDDLLSRLSNEGAELDKLFKRFTSEEVAQIVESSNLKTGVAPYLDQFYGKSTQNAATSGYVTTTIENAPTISDLGELVKDVTPVITGKASVTNPAATSTAQYLDQQNMEDFLASLNDL